MKRKDIKTETETGAAKCRDLTRGEIIAEADDLNSALDFVAERFAEILWNYIQWEHRMKLEKKKASEELEDSGRLPQ